MVLIIFLLLNYDYTLSFKEIFISALVLDPYLLHKFRYLNRYWEGKNGIGTSLVKIEAGEEVRNEAQIKMQQKMNRIE